MWQYWLTFAAVIVGAYFIGNISFSAIIARAAGKDIRKVGSGNPGTMNVLRNLGKPLGAVTLLLDALKGVFPAVFGWLLLGGVPGGAWQFFEFGPDKIGVIVAGLSAVVGHIYPVCNRFKGGKGVATSIGVALVINFGLWHGSYWWWWISFVAFGIGVLYLYFVQYGCITSWIITGISFGCAAGFAFADGYIAVGILCLVLYALIIFAHRGNIVRLIRREEKKTVIFGQDKRKARKAAVETESKDESA